MAATITVAGTFQAVAERGTNQGDSIHITNTGDEDPAQYDALDALNRDRYGYQELMQFVGEFAEANGTGTAPMGPKLAMVQIRDMLNALLTQPQNLAERVYTP